MDHRQEGVIVNAAHVMGNDMDDRLYRDRLCGMPIEDVDLEQSAIEAIWALARHVGADEGDTITIKLDENLSAGRLERATVTTGHGVTTPLWLTDWQTDGPLPCRTVGHVEADVSAPLYRVMEP